MTETLDEIKQAIANKYKINLTGIQSMDEGYFLKTVLAYLNPVIPSEEYKRLRSLMLNFTTSSNILALRLIYDKYVKNK